jgi:hypothetical protein
MNSPLADAARGKQVHRHEEFASGCEATCNGPYGGAWSKTMVRVACHSRLVSPGSDFRPRVLQIGYGTEETNFALELTYNYGISSYEKGNDLRCAPHAPLRSAS